MDAKQPQARAWMVAGGSAALLLLLTVLASLHRQPQPAPVQAAPAAAAQPAYGVNFISYPNSAPMTETRYTNGLSTGASWNRWPIYWSGVEQSEGVFSWAYVDTAVTADVAHGLQINAVLLGTPAMYMSSLSLDPGGRAPPERPSLLQLDSVQAATPQGLYEPVFNDGSNIPGPGKQINSANKWARFVYTAVNRYRPGGVLAQAEGWGPNGGVRHWEMWNEPDLTSFWDGSLADYARLLQVGYLAAKQADPQAQVLFGGLANDSSRITYYNDVLAIFDNDANADAFAYYHDIVATHNYLYAWESWYHVWRVGNALAARGLEKPIWLNETGVPVWNDYPGPICEPDSPYRATMTEQADFIIQSTLFATYAGADNIFFFQLYDDCGNQPGGTNFPYYPPSECQGIPALDPGGDAFGLFRNPRTGGCYWDHPQPETARPALNALQLLTTHFHGVEPLWRLRPGSSDPVDGPQEWIAFYKPDTGERVLGMWARFGTAETAVIPATNANGTGLLLYPDGTTQSLSATNLTYTVTLPAATNQNAIWDPTLYPIGGRPLLLIEADTLAPTVALQAPVTASLSIPLSWSGEDLGSGMAGYDLSVAVNGGAPTPWLTGTTVTSAAYPGAVNQTYTFTLVGEDGAGNRSAPVTRTVYTMDLPERLYLPIIARE